MRPNASKRDASFQKGNTKKEKKFLKNDGPDFPKFKITRFCAVECWLLPSILFISASIFVLSSPWSVVNVGGAFDSDKMNKSFVEASKHYLSVQPEIAHAQVPKLSRTSRLHASSRSLMIYCSSRL